jgi:hypothetical protein
MGTKLIQVVGLFDNGNAFLILSKAQRAARKSGWTPEQIDAFLTEAKSGDYDHLLQTTMKHFEEADEDNEEGCTIRERKPTKRHWVTVQGKQSAPATLELSEHDDDGYALGTVTIMGISFHVEAVEIVSSEDAPYGWRVRTDTYESRVNSYVAEYDTLPQLVQFDGRQWFLTITPHGV